MPWRSFDADSDPGRGALVMFAVLVGSCLGATLLDRVGGDEISWLRPALEVVVVTGCLGGVGLSSWMHHRSSGR